MRILEKDYKTKKKVKEAIKDIFTRYEDEQPLRGEDYDFVYDLLSNYHPNWEGKSHHGVRHIIVAICNDRGDKRFEIINDKGWRMDISYISCLRHDLNLARYDSLQAFRQEIKEQIKALECPAGHEVDHTPPLTFASLLFGFLKIEGKLPEECEIEFSKYGHNKTLKDRELATRWQEWHKEKAILRVITKEENSRLPKSKIKWEEIKCLT